MMNFDDYKLAYFYGDSMDSNSLTQDEVMVLADTNQLDDTYNSFELVIALIPTAAKLQDCGGDDWNDRPADANASGFYRYPDGTIFLRGTLGGKLSIEDTTPKLTTQEISDRRLGKRKVGKEYPFLCPGDDSRRWACSSFRPDGTVQAYIDEAVDKSDSSQDTLCHFCQNQNSYGKHGCPNHYTDEG